MARFDVSRLQDDDENSIEEVLQTKTIKSDPSSTYPSKDPTDEDEENEGDEPPHPLGFPSSFGRTRFSLDPPTPDQESLEHYKNRWGYLYPFEQADESDWIYDDDYVLSPQKFPLESNYINAQTAPSSSLLRFVLDVPNYRHNSVVVGSQLKKIDQPSDGSEIDKLAHLLQTAVCLDDRTVRSIVAASSSLLPPATTLRATYSLLETQRPRIQKEMAAEKQRLEQSHAEAAQALQKLLAYNEAKANKMRRLVEDKQRNDEFLQEEQEKQKLRDEAVVVAEETPPREDRAGKGDKSKRNDLDRPQVRIPKPSIPDVKPDVVAPPPPAAKEMDYVAKAEKLVAQLVEMRASVEPFEKSKAASKRRLGMKKIVNGRINTLAEAVDKIASVAQEVSRAIAEARSEDEIIKKQLEAGAVNVTPELARGKRYFLDLLSSNVIVRAQAEGFNGQRGDGFPLANMLAMISVDHKDLVPVLTAHVYTVCPVAIPTLPSPAADATEEDIMRSLGMLQQKDGSFETYDRFIARTESLVSLVADIMASEPSDHVLFGGHEGAVKWLSRFLKLLPSAPHSPLPLITAPVLDAFLTAAGHMLANKHPTHFQRYLERISSDVIHRLDEGSIGKPSSIRLRKTISEGFEGFRSKLPSRALSEFYVGAKKGAPSVSHSKSQASPFPTNTAPSGSISARPNPFAPATAPQSTFRAEPLTGTSSSNPFSGNESSSMDVKSTLMDSTEDLPTSTSANWSASPFGTSQASPFGKDLSSSSTSKSGGLSTMLTSPSFGSSATTQSPFGAGTSKPFDSSRSPFATSNANSGNLPTPFQTSISNASPFGSAAPGPSPFGSFPATNTVSIGTSSGGLSTFGSNVQSPFGNPTSTTSSVMPFGAPTTGSSPFGAPAPSSLPFGASASSTSPFGAPTPSMSHFGAPAPSTSPFGALAPSASPFGAPSTGLIGSPSPFSAPAPSSSSFGGPGPSPSPFGAAAPSPSPFGAAASPFGAPAQGFVSSSSKPSFSSVSPFGMSAPSPSPFGASSSSFGLQSSSTPFGASSSSFGLQSSSTPFGSGSAPPFGQSGFSGNKDSRPPCKFFAEGRCKFGDSCKFSHELPSSGAQSFASSTPFGGPRR